MSFKGSMEDWEPEECTGYCGKCYDCEQFNDMKGDQEYEAWRAEQNELTIW